MRRTSPLINLLESFDDTVDVATVAVATEADAHESGCGAHFAATGVGHQTGDFAAVEPEQLGDVRVGAEATRPDADAVLVAKYGGDESWIPAIDTERDHPE